MNNRSGSYCCKTCFPFYKEDPFNFFSNWNDLCGIFLNVPTNYSGSIRSFTCCLEVTHISFPLKTNFFQWFFFFRFSYISSLFWLLKLIKSSSSLGSKELTFAGGFLIHMVTESTFACFDHYQMAKSILWLISINDILKNKEHTENTPCKRQYCRRL